MAKTWVTVVKGDKPLLLIPLAKGEEVHVVINDEPAVDGRCAVYPTTVCQTGAAGKAIGFALPGVAATTPSNPSSPWMTRRPAMSSNRPSPVRHAVIIAPRRAGFHHGRSTWLR